MARVFAVWVQNKERAGAVAVHAAKWQKIVQIDKTGKGQWRSVGFTNLSRSPKIVQLENFYYV
jgi:hypothetical protein